jgi:protein-disulfide isomerase
MNRVGISEPREDFTRKQRRERARAQRRALEEAEVAKAVRRTRLRWLGIVSAAVVVGIVVVVIASAGGAGVRNIAPESGPARQVRSEVTALLAGIPQAGDALGRATAPVTLQYFGDLECPVCRAFTLSALPTIIQRWVRTGELRVEYRSLETATREPEVFKAQQAAALAAGKQNRMWNFVETFYHEQQEEDTGYVTENYLQGIATQVDGLNLSRWTSDRNDPALANELSSDAQVADNRGLDGTPAFLIGRSGAATNRLEPSSFTEPAAFNGAIEKLIGSIPALG